MKHNKTFDFHKSSWIKEIEKVKHHFNSVDEGEPREKGPPGALERGATTEGLCPTTREAQGSRANEPCPLLQNSGSPRPADADKKERQSFPDAKFIMLNVQSGKNGRQEVPLGANRCKSVSAQEGPIRTEN